MGKENIIRTNTNVVPKLLGNELGFASYISSLSSPSSVTPHGVIISVNNETKEYILKTKAYIQIGSECPICLFPINKKNNAWITSCGHSFHRICLMQSYITYMNNPNITHYSNCLPCPICREDLPTCCCGFDLARYQSKYGERRNELDCLENFEVLSELLQPLDCYKCKKYIGMNSNCKVCKDYQINGNNW